MCPTGRDDPHTLWKQIAGTNDPSRMVEAFTVLDRDGDGEIRPADLTAFFSSCVGESISEEEISTMIAIADLDGDGAIDLQEFQSLMTIGMEAVATKMSPSESSALREMFNVLDQNKDGMLCREDLRGAMKMFGQAVNDEELDAMIEAAGGSKKKTSIDFQHFSNFLTIFNR